MIGLDTNVLVRYLTQDDPNQSSLANELIEEILDDQRPGFVQTIVMVELVWVLETGYARNRSQIAHILEQLLRARSLSIERADLISQATATYASTRADFADCLIERVGGACGCEQTLTFDKIAARDTGMKLLDRS